MLKDAPQKYRGLFIAFDLIVLGVFVLLLLGPYV